MSLPRETVMKVAGLARLQLTEAEIESLSVELGATLEFVAVLDEVNVAGVEPMVHAIELSNVLRDDVPVPSLRRAAALANAPKSDGKYFQVPAIIES